jgi:hypothetical protein
MLCFFEWLRDLVATCRCEDCKAFRQTLLLWLNDAVSPASPEKHWPVFTDKPLLVTERHHRAFHPVRTN